MEVATVKLDLTKSKCRVNLISVRDLTKYETWYAHYHHQYLRIENIEIVRNPFTGVVERKRIYFNLSEDKLREIVDADKRYVRIHRDTVRTVFGNMRYETLKGYVELDITPKVMKDLCNALFKLTLRHVELERHLDWLNYSRSEFGKSKKECGRGVYNFDDIYYGVPRSSHRYIVDEDAFDDIHKIYEDGMYYEED